MLEKYIEEQELALGKIEQRAVGLPDLAFRGIQNASAECIPLGRARLGFLSFKPVAPQDIVDAQGGFPDVEGPRDIVVRAVLEACQAFNWCTSSRNHDDRDIAHGPDLEGKLQTILLAETEIECDEVDGFSFETVEEGRLVSGFRHREALSFQALSQDGAKLRFIIDDKNMDRGSRHRPDLVAGCQHLLALEYPGMHQHTRPLRRTKPWAAVRTAR
jgi:hypothetical protein